MRKLFENFIRCFKFNSRVVILAIFWLLGIGLGYLGSVFARHQSGDILESLIVSETSILRLWIVHLFPFVLAAFAHKFSLYCVFYFLNMFKAFSYSFCGFAVIFAFGSAGWLVRILFLFSDAFSVLLLFYFTLGCLCSRNIGKSEYILIFFSVATVCVIDSLAVSPFLSSILSR